MDRTSYVYIMASRRNGTLYVGVTTDLPRRVFEHRQGLTPGFTSKYGVKHLVWYEEYGDVTDAIAREKTLKHWRRAWKLAPIEAQNPQWLDLWDVMHAPPPAGALTAHVPTEPPR